MRWFVCSLLSAAALVAGCSSDEGSPATTTSTTLSPEPGDGPTAIQFRVMAQEQIGRSINGVDYECEIPVSTVPGTEFNCAGELNGNKLRVIATINPDATVTLTMLD